MDARDICAIGDVLAEGVDGTTKRVEEVHQAVADRSFRAAGPIRRWPQAIHDRLAARVYSTVRTVAPAAIRSGALGLGTAVDPEAARVYGTPRGKALVSAFNGVFGDALARRRNGLALQMAIRTDGQDVQTSAAGLAGAFPNATGRIAVFVHGFGETDDSWHWFAHAHWNDSSVSYGELLRRERGYTPVYIHYNSGRSIDLNGAELSDLLEQAVLNWPVPLYESVLVGHSAGGHVVKSAVRQGAAAGDRWVRTVRYIFSLGTPRAAQLAERAVQASVRALGALPETRPLSELLNARSAGLKDLRTETDGPLPEWIEHVALPSEGTKIGHFRLLNHPAIYLEIKARLTDRTVHVPVRAAREARYERVARALRAQRPSRRR
jgi:hypothetical protein